jgi:acyl dehydratase
LSLNLNLVSHRWDAGVRNWSSTDALLYALGVGAGAQNLSTELAFTTENSHGVVQQVLPTFPVVLRGGNGPSFGDVDFAQMLHAEQGVTILGPIPVEGSVRIASCITGIYDKGSGALVTQESLLTDVRTDRPIAKTRSGIFFRGEGGFNGQRGESGSWSLPKRPADHVVVYPTRTDQALLYRLSGDRNPLHSDPWMAARAGFGRPILHGLCTYGITARALLHSLCDSDPSRFGSMSVRFSVPVFPGQDLSVYIWDEGNVSLFVTRVGETVVLDRGVFERASK